jgi:hypothetical protein
MNLIVTKNKLCGHFRCRCYSYSLKGVEHTLYFRQIYPLNRYVFQKRHSIAISARISRLNYFNYALSGEYAKTPNFVLCHRLNRYETQTNNSEIHKQHFERLEALTEWFVRIAPLNS